MIECQGRIHIINIVQKMEKFEILLFADAFWIFLKTKQTVLNSVAKLN